jgi:hypothetical protein
MLGNHARTMPVTLEDGTEAHRPFTTRRNEEGAEAQLPTAYPGEEAVFLNGGWVMRRLRR